MDALATPDTAALRGRRIALDPGHGGAFPGAAGAGGLTEAEVNLGVALHLRGLLEAAGASVLMTRTDDRDFLTPADSSLRADLAARVEIANGFDPDLFVSIHHNADAGGAHDVNEIQTYYKLGDEGPSLDAAQSVHRFLVRNLGIARHRVVPGNYFVLRNSVAPGLLTESSYITNPDVAARLALASKQRLEAEALYLGIARFFARGAPRVAWLRTTDSDAASAGAGPGIEARIDGPFDQADLRLDGRAVTPMRAGDRLWWRPGAPLAPGTHDVRLAARLGGAGASRAAGIGFTIARPAATIEAEGLLPEAGGPVAVRVRVRDRFGMPVPDTLAVRLSTGPGLAPRDTTLVARGGEAWGYLRGAGRGAPAARAELVAADGAPCRACADSVSWRRTPPGAWSGFLGLAPESLAFAPPAAAAPGALDGPPWIARDGFALLPRDSSGAPALPAVPGWRRLGARGDGPPRLVAIAGGALHGRRVVIDADGGGDDPGGVGRDGTRAAHLDLEVARTLAGFLRAAGADVLLTRSGDLALSDVERVQMSEAFGAERFLRVGHRAEPPRVGYYFSSAAGRAWAERAADALADFGFARPAPAADAQYPLQQTSCPALYVSAVRVDDPAGERALRAPGALRAEAYALFLALAREWAPDAVWPPDSVEVRDDAGTPVAGAVVTLGGAIVLETGPSGRARFARTEPGALEAAFVVPGDRTRRTVLLDSQRGVTLTGPGEP